MKPCELVWSLLLGTLLVGFAVMDGFDLGAAMLMPFVARTDTEPRIVINTIGPVWEGNRVWLIFGAGAVFAAWPMLYAVAFSGFSLAMFLALGALILRPVNFKFHSEIENPLWRWLWDFVLFVSGAVPALMFGIVIGNVLQGLPFCFGDTLRTTYEGDLLGLLNPLALLCGLVICAMLVLHGGAYLALKADQPVADRAANMARQGAFVLFAPFALGGVFAGHGIDGYKVMSGLARDGPSNPLLKTVTRVSGALLSNYNTWPWMMLAPVLVFAGAAMTSAILQARRNGFALMASGVAVAGVVATAGFSAIPFLLPSSLDPNASLTVSDASASRSTSLIMFFATLVFLPLVLAYTAFVYRVPRGRVTMAYVEDNSSTLY